MNDEVEQCQLHISDDLWSYVCCNKAVIEKYIVSINQLHTQSQLYYEQYHDSLWSY